MKMSKKDNNKKYIKKKLKYKTKINKGYKISENNHKLINYKSKKG